MDEKKEPIFEEKKDNNLKKIGIIGITGHQGSNVMNELLKYTHKYEIIGFTRDINSFKSKNISSKYNITMIQGSPREPKLLTKSFKDNKLYGLFFVVQWKGKSNSGKTEGTDGISIIDCAINAGIKHVIFSSVADAETDSAGKWKVEQYMHKIYQKEGKNGLRYTILRPVTCMDNFTNESIAKPKGGAITFITKEDTPLQLISHKDIARFCVHALNADNNDTFFINNTITLVGDIKSGNQICGIIGKACNISLEWKQFGLIIRAFMYNFVNKLENGGFRIKQNDIDKLKEIEPELWNFETFIQQNKACFDAATIGGNKGAKKDNGCIIL